MKIRFVIDNYKKKKKNKKRYSLQIKRFFKWTTFSYTCYSYGGSYKQTFFSKNKKELLHELKQYYNKSTIELIEYSPIKRYDYGN